MDIQQLLYFQALAMTQHMTRAAAELNITQPALSSSLSRLEKELDLPLFQRSGRQIVLNSNGKIFLKSVNVILDEYQEVMNELKKIKEENNLTLSLLVSGTHFPKNIIRGFRQENPHISIRQHLVLYDQLTSNYFTREFDFLLSAYPVDFPHCKMVPVYNEAFYLAVSVKHPLAVQSEVSLEELKQESFILLPKGHIFREMCDSMCSKAGFSPNVAIECYPSQISELLENTVNVAFTVESALYSKEFGPDIRLLPISTPGCSRKISLVYPENASLTSSAKLFLQYCRTYEAHINNTRFIGNLKREQ